DLRGVSTLVAGDTDDPVADGPRRRRRGRGAQHDPRAGRARGDPWRSASLRARLARTRMRESHVQALPAKALELREIGKTFALSGARSVVAVRDFTLRIEPGELVT